jgi:hypothetical protein
MFLLTDEYETRNAVKMLQGEGILAFFCHTDRKIKFYIKKNFKNIKKNYTFVGRILAHSLQHDS